MEKRAKCKNFPDREIAMLLDVIEMYMTIENKKTDAVTSKEKGAAWDNMTCRFNSSNSGPPRTTLQLKNFYDNFKRKTRKEQADDKANLHLTGGGTFKNALGVNGERLLNMMKEQFVPDHNLFDSESRYHENIEPSPIVVVVKPDKTTVHDAQI